MSKHNYKDVNIQVYIASTEGLEDDSLYQRLFATVPAYRKAKASSYKFSKDRYLSLAAALLLGHALRQAGYEEKHLVIAYGENDRPYFRCHPELSFSLSHSGQRAMCAIAVTHHQHEPAKKIHGSLNASTAIIPDCPCSLEIGCDVEEITGDQAVFLQQNNLTVAKWTCLESYAKAMQTDLDALFRQRTAMSPDFIFTQPKIEPQYEYTICCRYHIPRENIHILNLREFAKYAGYENSSINANKKAT